MRVALVLAASSGAGTETHAHRLAEGLRAGGDEVALYGPARLTARFELTAEVEILAGPGPRDVAAIAALRRALRSDPVDVVHAFGLRAGLVAGLARPAGVPLAVTWVHQLAGHGVRRTTDRALARVVAGTAEVTLCPTEELAELAERLGARRVARVPMVAPRSPGPVRDRAAVRAEFELAPEAPLVLAVGRLDAERRHDVLVAAAIRWRSLRPMPTVLIGGVGPAYRDLAAQAMHGRAPVIMIGQRDDLPELLVAADVAVLAGAIAASPLFAQEALAAGVPLVAPALPGLAELVGSAAILVPAGDTDALDVAVRTLLADADRRAALAVAGLAQAARWPDEAAALAAVRSAYEEILPTAATSTRLDDAPGELR